MTTTQQSHYTLLFQLGQGGFGTVSLARDPSGTLVAIKQPLPNRSLDKERSLLTHLHEPDPIVGIPRLLDTVAFDPRDGDRVSLVLDYVEGRRIRDLAEYSLPLLTVTSYVTEFLAILSHVHARRIVHGDLHDKNILLDTDGHIHVIDFGLACLVDADLPRVFQSDVWDMISIVKDWLTYLPRQTDCSIRRTLLSRLDELRDAFWQQECSSASLLVKWSDLLIQVTGPKSIRIGIEVQTAKRVGSSQQAQLPLLSPSLV